MAIGYGRARNLMRQLDWKMRATVMMGSVNKIELYHPEAPGDLHGPPGQRPEAHGGVP